MRHSLTRLLLWALAVLLAPAARAQALPARPQPFAFVTDQTNTLTPTEASNLERGLRAYAAQNGTQVVVVLVKTLGGREATAFAQALGSSWGVGQRARDNGVVVLLAPSERKVAIAPGSGLAAQLPPRLTSQIIAQQFEPAFKRGSYYAGLRAGLNVLLKAADPSAAPAAPAAPAGAAGARNAAAAPAAETAPAYANRPNPAANTAPTVPEASPGLGGIGLGTILLLLGGAALLWFFFRRRAAANAPAAPYPGGTQAPGNAPDFLGRGPARNAGNYGPGYGPPPAGNTGSGMGSGMGGMLGTAAAAAAGAAVGGYLMNRHDQPDGRNASALDGQQAGFGGALPPTDNDLPPAAAHDYFADRDGSANANTDYFSGNEDATPDNSSYDDLNSDDTGGSFDGGSDDSSGGSW